MARYDFQELKAAVISLACEDYLNLLAGFGLASYNKNNAPAVTVEELESFFTGDDFDLYSDLDGKDLMEKVRRLAKTMVVKIDVVRISSHSWGCCMMDDKFRTVLPGSSRRTKHEAIEYAASLNGLSVLNYQKCRMRDGLA